MERFSGNYIDCCEKTISVQQIYQMYQERKIVFPKAPLVKKSKKIERISEIIEIILLGFVLPTVYVSERQDGSLLVLESEDRLRCLIDFLEGRYPVRGLEFYPELDECGIGQLERQFPRRTSWLYDYKFSFLIIEYTTPRYLHMQMGSYIERWNFTREQGIRNELYGEELERRLIYMEQRLCGSPAFFSKVSLNRQYMVLRILMYRFARTGDIRAGLGESLSIQQLLDCTAVLILKKDSQWISDTADAFRKATGELLGWRQRSYFYLDLKEGKGIEQKAKVLGYLYNVVWICQEKECGVQWGLEQVIGDKMLWRDIESGKTNLADIRTCFEMIEERVQ